MSEDSGADVISDLEEGEIPEFEVTTDFIKKQDLFIHSKDEKSIRAPNVENQWKFKKDQSVSNNSLFTRRSPKSSAKNNVIDYKNESLTQFDSPLSEGECTSEDDRNTCGNNTFQKYLFSKKLNENRSKYLYPFQTTYGTVQDIMTKIDKTLAKNNDCYYKKRRSKETRYNLDLANNRAKNSLIKGSSPVYLNKFKSNYCKKRRYSENNDDSDSKVWEKKDRTKNLYVINGNKKGNDIKNKKKREYEVIIENKNNTDNSKKFRSSKKYERDYIDCRKKELDLLKTRSSNEISTPYDEIPLPQESLSVEKENNVKSRNGSNSNTSCAAISPTNKHLSNIFDDQDDTSCNNNDLISHKSDKTSEQYSGDDEDVELIKLRLIALTSNKKKNQSLIAASNESHCNTKSDLEQEISEFVCEYKITDDFEFDENLATDTNSTSYKTSSNSDIDRSELLLRAEALKTALMKKHKHRIKKLKNSSHFTNTTSELVENNLENSGENGDIESNILNLNKCENVIQKQEVVKTDVLKHVNSFTDNTKDVPSEATSNNALNMYSEENEPPFKFNSLEVPELILNKDIVLENEKSINISCAIPKDSVPEDCSDVNSKTNNFGNITNDNNSKFSDACSSGSVGSNSDSSSNINYKINNNNNSNNNNNNNSNNNNNNNNNNPFKENKLLRKQFKKKRWKSNKKMKNLTLNKSNVKENKNQVKDNHEEDVQKLRTQLLNDLLKKKKKLIEDEKKSVLIDKLQTSNIQQTEKIKIKKYKTTIKPQNFQKSKGADKLYGEMNATPKPKMPEMELERIIVYLGSDSSDEDCVLENKSKTESVLDSNLNKNSENLKEKNITIKAVENKKEDYEKSVDLLLKEARKRVERKSELVPETQTREAVFSHLPPSQRLEYLRLKQKIAEREKLKKSKKTVNIPKPSPEKNDSSASKDKKISEEENNGCNSAQLSDGKTAVVPSDSKFAPNIENNLSEGNIKTENENKSSASDVKLVSIAAKLCKQECTSNELNVNAKRNTVSICDKVSYKKASTQSGNAKSGVSERNAKSCVRSGTLNNETGMAKTLLERKKVLMLNRLHLERLKILWKNIRAEKFIEQKYEKEIKRLKIQQNFFELKLNQQRSKIKKLAEESKHIYEVFQKNNKGFGVNYKQNLPVIEKATPNVSKSCVVTEDANERNGEAKSDNGPNPAQSAARAEESLPPKIEGAEEEATLQKSAEKEKEKQKEKEKVSVAMVPADGLKEYDSPLKIINNGSEFSDCMRIDPNTIMCHFDLLGKCNDEECNYQHWRTNSN